MLIPTPHQGAGQGRWSISHLDWFPGIEGKTEEYMFQRGGSGLRRAVVMAASVAGFGMMAAMAGGAVAADKGGAHDEYFSAQPNCSINQDWSNIRKCGDTQREPRAGVTPGKPKGG